MFTRSLFIGCLLSLAALFSPLRAADFQTGPVQTDHVEAELVSEVAAIRPGQSFEIALRLKMDPHWHVYWINPGDTGLAPSVEWQLPEGYEVGPLRFPYPRLLPTPPLVSYGYDGEVLLLATVKAPASSVVGSTATINGAAEWLVCDDACIPGSASLSLQLPVTATGESFAPSPFASKFEATRKELPVAATGGTIHSEMLADSVVITLKWSGLAGAKLSDPHFFIEQEAISDSAAKQSFDLVGDELRIAISKSDYFDQSIERYTGVLFSENGFAAAGGAKAVRFSETGQIGAGSSAVASAYKIGFVQALFYAFLGGLILNLMPCVFPVLSIKVLGFVQQSGEDKGQILKHGIAFTAGVLISFWTLAGSLLALRSAGEGLGWGFQLQQPEFVIVLLVIMFLFGLSLAGVFEVGASAISLAGKVKSDGFGGSFFSGVIATAVATPCTGPFMGPALGFALTLSAVEAMSIFSLLGLGMASPYLILSANPRLINKLPRPGAWMETFKQVMAFPMFATCIWLVWLLGAHVGNDGLVGVLGGLLVIAIGAWIYGRWSTPMRKASTRRLSAALALLILGGGIWVMLPRKAAETDREIAWQTFSPELIAKLDAEGTPMFVDFTADWCLTCKANELRVFSSDKVVDRMEELGIAMIQGDWTKKDPRITKFLERFGVSGVPLYLLYSGKPGEAPKVLPQLLSPDVVLEALDEIEPASRESIALSR